MSRALEISVIIPTHNRRASVERTVLALGAQICDPARFETIVVADGCSDDTAAHLDGLRLPFPLTVVVQHRQGQGKARNEGAARARGEILVFLDDDIEPLPGLLEAYREAHRLHPDHLLIGQSTPVLGDDSSLFHQGLRNWWHDHFQSLQAVAHRYTYRDMLSGNFAMAAALFARAGGFDPDFFGRSGEDYEFGARLIQRRVPFRFLPHALAYHHDSTNFERSLVRVRMEGRADVVIGLRHPELRPGLPLTWITRNRSRAKRWLGRAAFQHPHSSSVIVRLLGALLRPLESLRLRTSWRRVHGVVRDYWYARGVADELGTVAALRSFLEDGKASGGPALAVDLANGVERARRVLDQLRPAAVELRFEHHDLGRVSEQRGAEALAGRHLGPALMALAPKLLVAQAGQLADPEARVRSLESSDPSRITVIIATGNDPTRLGRTLKSLLPPVRGIEEILVIGNPITCTAAIERSGLVPERIRVVRGSEVVPAAWNHGVTLASSDWLLFLRPGDRVEGVALDTVLAAIGSNPRTDVIRGAWEEPRPAGEPRYLDSGNLAHVLAEYRRFRMSATVLKREKVLAAGGFDRRASWGRFRSLAARGGRSAGSITTGAVIDLELTRPVDSVNCEGSDFVAALVRFQGRPLGWLHLPCNGAEMDGVALHDAALNWYGWELATRALPQRNGSATSETRPPISVVICTRNRPQLLERCLASVARLAYPHFEVIVVDNAPADAATRDVVARFPARYVREDRTGLDWARNRGIAEARHGIIAFTDDDATPDARWLDGLASGFENPAIMAVTGLVAPMELATQAQLLFEAVYGGMGKGMQGRLHHRDLMRPAQMIAIHAVGVGVNMAFRREALDRLGGFDTALDVGTAACGGGDLDVFHRIIAAGMPLWYEPRALVWHQHRRELADLRRQLYNDGRSFAVYLLKLWRDRTVPRRSVARYAVWVWGRWLAGRVILGMLGRHRLPLSILWANFRGACDGPRAFRATYRQDRMLKATAGVWKHSNA